LHLTYSTSLNLSTRYRTSKSGATTTWAKVKKK
jgi:hypothetical protein